MNAGIDEIKKLLGSEKLIIGAQGVLKALRKGSLAKAYLASNAPPAVRSDIERFGGLGGVAVIMLDVPNDELGTMCKKPFPIGVIGILQ